MPAMDVNDDAGCLDARVVWAFFASRLAPTIGSGGGGGAWKMLVVSYAAIAAMRRPDKPAPTGECGYPSKSGRLEGRLALDFEVHAPSRGRAQVLRSGQTGMDAGLAALGQGWPVAAGPRSRTGARACRATARHRTTGAKAFGYLALLQVTRRKGETISGRYCSNGYVHHPGFLRANATLPVGASMLAKNIQTTRVFRHPASSLKSIASRLAPTIGSGGVPERRWSSARQPSLASQLPQGNVDTRKSQVGSNTASF